MSMVDFVSFVDFARHFSHIVELEFLGQLCTLWKKLKRSLFHDLLSISCSVHVCFYMHMSNEILCRK